MHPDPISTKYSSYLIIVPSTNGFSPHERELSRGSHMASASISCHDEIWFSEMPRLTMLGRGASCADSSGISEILFADTTSRDSLRQRISRLYMRKPYTYAGRHRTASSVARQSLKALVPS